MTLNPIEVMPAHPPPSQYIISPAGFKMDLVQDSRSCPVKAGMLRHATILRLSRDNVSIHETQHRLLQRLPRGLGEPRPLRGCGRESGLLPGPALPQQLLRRPPALPRLRAHRPAD